METIIHRHLDEIAIERRGDAAGVAEITKRMHNEGFGSSPSGELKHAASIPDVIIEKYCNDNGITFEELMANPDHAKRMLNNPDLAAFRIWKGRV